MMTILKRVVYFSLCKLWWLLYFISSVCDSGASLLHVLDGHRSLVWHSWGGSLYIHHQSRSVSDKRNANVLPLLYSSWNCVVLCLTKLTQNCAAKRWVSAEHIMYKHLYNFFPSAYNAFYFFKPHELSFALHCLYIK